jgi:hypothetical protein
MVVASHNAPVRENGSLEPIEDDGPAPGGRSARLSAPLVLLLVVALVTAAVAGTFATLFARHGFEADQRRTERKLLDLSSRLRQMTPPRQVTVPNVTGLTRREAEAILAVAGLRTFGDPSDQAPAAIVLAQDPAGGTLAERGSGVQLSAKPGTVPVQGPVEAVGSARDLAARAGCEGIGPADTHDGPPGTPAARTAVSCAFGEAHTSIRTYDSEASVTAILEANGPFCGYRTVGRTWIAAVDTEETAWRLQNSLGGRVVQFAGCAG